jgi:HTH-type transcriptional regulator, cell division transcriptional repressor
MTDMPLGERVRERRRALKLTQQQLAKAVRSLGGELSQQQLAAIESGTVKRPRALPELATSLKTTPADLLHGDGATPGPMQQDDHKIVTEADTHRTPLGFAPEALILFRSAEGGRNGGETLVYKERAGIVPRPDFLRYAKEAFASIVTNDLNAPAYRTRDTVLIDPTHPAVVGDDCMFVRNSGANPMETVSAHLVKITATTWTVHQYSGKQKDYDLPRSEFHEAWRIVGRYNR